MTLTLPSVSTLGNFFTIAFLFDIRKTPNANVTVTTIGSPSGIAATANETKPQPSEIDISPDAVLEVRLTSDREHFQPGPLLNYPDQTDHSNHTKRNY